MRRQKSVDWMKDLRLAARSGTSMHSLMDESQGTNSALLRDIKTLSNAPGWLLFYQTYAPMLTRFGLRSGLTHIEAQEVVQSTMIHVAKKISNFTYDRAKGSFKAWLFHTAKWRILDAFAARPKNTIGLPDLAADPRAESSTPRWEPAVSVFEDLWDDECRAQLWRDALTETRRKVSPVQYQIFYHYVIEGLPAKEVAKMLGASVAQVHLARCRVGLVVKKELAKLRAAEREPGTELELETNRGTGPAPRNRTP